MQPIIAPQKQKNCQLDEPVLTIGASRLGKPTTASFFKQLPKTQTTEAESHGTKEHRHMLQTMYLAAMEPLSSLVTSYRRIALDEELWDSVYNHTFGDSRATIRPYWHRRDVSESLKSYWDSVVHRLGVQDGYSGRQSFYALVPMSGCSHDLVWLYHQGVFVTGVESNQRAVNTFVNRHRELKLERCLLPNGIQFCRTPDRRLRIFVCNFFTCCSYLDHQYNFVWDRCAFSCLNVDQRKAYVRQLMHCRAENFHLLIETMEYDPTVFLLPPHPVFDAEIQELLGQHLRTENVSRVKTIVNWKAAVMTAPFKELFRGPFLPTDLDPFQAELQITLMCNEF